MNIIRRNILLATAAGLALAGQAAFADGIGLYEYAFNIDGTVTSQSAPAGVNLSAFDTTTGLGSISVTLTGAGSHYVSVFVDHEIDETTNTFSNESGSTSGVAAAGQSWEIDEPGYTFGDIYDNFLASSLDGSNGVPAGFEDDVSMAMGWDFVLAADQTAIIQFILSDATLSGFQLVQYDADSDKSIYFGSTLKIESSVVPLPAAGWLFGSVIAGAVALGRRRKTDRQA